LFHSGKEESIACHRAVPRPRESCLRSTIEGSAFGSRLLNRSPFLGPLALRLGDLLTIPPMALSVGFIRFLRYGVSDFSLMGVPSTEHAGLRWTHKWSKYSCGTEGINSANRRLLLLHNRYGHRRAGLARYRQGDLNRGPWGNALWNGRINLVQIWVAWRKARKSYVGIKSADGHRNGV
jgi:hypothetical protein